MKIKNIIFLCFISIQLFAGDSTSIVKDTSAILRDVEEISNGVYRVNLEITSGKYMGTIGWVNYNPDHPILDKVKKIENGDGYTWKVKFNAETLMDVVALRLDPASIRKAEEKIAVVTSPPCTTCEVAKPKCGDIGGDCPVLQVPTKVDENSLAEGTVGIFRDVVDGKVKLEITSGPHAGRIAWVNSNPKEPTVIKIKPKDKEDTTFWKMKITRNTPVTFEDDHLNQSANTKINPVPVNEIATAPLPATEVTAVVEPPIEIKEKPAPVVQPVNRDSGYFANRKGQWQQLTRNIKISSEDNNGISREVIFNDEGHVLFFSNFKSAIHTNTGSTGARGYYLLPFNSKKSMVFKGNDDVAVKLPCGEELGFDDRGMVDSQKSSSNIVMTVDPKISGNNMGGVEISSYKKGIVIDLGWAQGKSPGEFVDRKIKVIDKNGERCDVVNSELIIQLGKGDFKLRYNNNESMKKFLQKRCPKLNLEDF